MPLFKKKKPKFPTLAVVLLVLAVIWLINAMGYFAVNIPWIPVILIVIAIGMIINRYKEWFIFVFLFNFINPLLVKRVEAFIRIIVLF